MPKNKCSQKRFSLPFILFTTKSKYRFVNGIVKEIEISLNKSGKKMALTTKFKLQVNLLKMVGAFRED